MAEDFRVTLPSDDEIDSSSFSDDEIDSSEDDDANMLELRVSDFSSWAAGPDSLRHPMSRAIGDNRIAICLIFIGVVLLVMVYSSRLLQ